jgi:hypothetical protein
MTSTPAPILDPELPTPIELFEEALRAGASKEDAIAVGLDNGLTLAEIDQYIALKPPDFVETLRTQKGSITAYSLMTIKNKAKKMDDPDFAMTLAERLDPRYSPKGNPLINVSLTGSLTEEEKKKVIDVFGFETKQIEQ